MKTVPRTVRLLSLLFLSALATASAGAPGGRPASKDAVGCSRVYTNDFSDTHFALDSCRQGGSGCYDCYYNNGGTLTECYESPDGTSSYCWGIDYQNW